MKTKDHTNSEEIVKKVDLYDVNPVLVFLPEHIKEMLDCIASLNPDRIDDASRSYQHRYIFTNGTITVNIYVAPQIGNWRIYKDYDLKDWESYHDDNESTTYPMFYIDGLYEFTETKVDDDDYIIDVALNAAHKLHADYIQRLTLEQKELYYKFIAGVAIYHFIPWDEGYKSKINFDADDFTDICIATGYLYNYLEPAREKIFPIGVVPDN